MGAILSCSKEEEPIRLNKNTMYISNNGGSDTIMVLNYHQICLSGEAKVHLNDSVFWVRSEQNTQYQEQFEVEGGWFKIIVPYKTPNLIVASIEEGKLNPDDNVHIIVGISNADKFGRIEIKSK